MCRVLMVRNGGVPAHRRFGRDAAYVHELAEQWASLLTIVQPAERRRLPKPTTRARDRYPILGGIGKKRQALPGTLIIRRRALPRPRKGVLVHSTAFERRLVSMKNTLKLVTIMVALSVTSLQVAQ